MYSLRDFFMYKDSRYSSGYRTNVFWLSANVRVGNSEINQHISQTVTFFGSNDLNIEITNQIHFYQYNGGATTPTVEVTFILYAYDNNQTLIG